MIGALSKIFHFHKHCGSINADSFLSDLCIWTQNQKGIDEGTFYFTTAKLF